jgi:hypothetical protein
MTRLGLIPQLMDIILTNSAEQATATTTGGTGSAASYVQFTVTTRLRPYTSPPPASQLEVVTP